MKATDEGSKLSFLLQKTLAHEYTSVSIYCIRNKKENGKNGGNCIVAYLHMWPKSNKSPIFVMIDHAAKSTFF